MEAASATIRGCCRGWKGIALSVQALFLLAAIALGPIRLNGGSKSAADDSEWKEFASTKYHFTVQYPASWYRLGDATDILDITNFKRSRPEDGIATAVAGAEIAVTGARPGVRSVDDWIHRDLPDSDNAAASEDNVSILKLAAGGCTRLKEAAWRDEIAPEVYFTETAYYCATDAGLYKISLLNWQNDPSQSRLRALAVKIALSLRAGRFQ